MRDPLLSRFLIRFKLPIAAGALALVAAGVVAWWRKSVIWSLSAGMVTLWLVAAVTG